MKLDTMFVHERQINKSNADGHMHMLYSQSQDKNFGNWKVFLTSLLLTEPVCGASLIYSSIVERNDGGGC